MILLLLLLLLYRLCENMNAKLNYFGALQRLQSPIHIAAEQGYSEICKLLLSAGANIEQREQVNICILV